MKGGRGGDSANNNNDAPPPLEAVASMVLVGIVALIAFPSMSAVDEIAKPEIFTNVLFPSYVSLSTVLYIRGGFALICFATTCYSLFLSKGYVLRRILRAM
jgi:hypothetical protein